MKFKIAAGAELDLLTKKEVGDELRGMMTSWFGEVSRGDRYRRFSEYGDADGSGAVTIGATGGQRIGPSEGFVWSVKRLALSGGYNPATQVLALYLNGISDSALVTPDLAAYNSFDSNQLVLYSGDKLILTGTATASTRIWVTGQVRELPAPLAWRL